MWGKFLLYGDEKGLGGLWGERKWYFISLGSEEGDIQEGLEGLIRGRTEKLHSRGEGGQRGKGSLKSISRRCRRGPRSSLYSSFNSETTALRNKRQIRAKDKQCEVSPKKGQETATCPRAEETFIPVGKRGRDLLSGEETRNAFPLIRGGGGS